MMWYKNNPDDKIWWLNNPEVKGKWVFSFDKERIFNMFRDQKKQKKPYYDKGKLYYLVCHPFVTRSDIPYKILYRFKY